MDKRIKIHQWLLLISLFLGVSIGKPKNELISPLDDLRDSIHAVDIQIAMEERKDSSNFKLIKKYEVKSENFKKKYAQVKDEMIEDLETLEKLKTIEAKLVAEAPFEAEEKAVLSEVKESSQWVWIVVLAGIFSVVIGGYLFWKRREREYEHFKNKIDSSTATIPITKAGDYKMDAGSLSEIAGKQLKSQSLFSVGSGWADDEPEPLSVVKEDPETLEEPLVSVNENPENLVSEGLESTQKAGVLRLAKRGATATEISQRLRISREEVELIIRHNLEQKY